MDGKRAWGGQTGGAIKKPSEYIDNVVDVLEARRLRVSVKEHKDLLVLEWGEGKGTTFHQDKVSSSECLHTKKQLKQFSRHTLM